MCVCPGVLVQEFVVQHGENGNPPTLYLALESLVQEMKNANQMVSLSQGASIL